MSEIKFEDPERIIAALATLRPEQHRLTLTRESDASDWLGVQSLRLSPAGDQIILVSADAHADIIAWPDTRCRLTAANDEESLVFTGLHLAPAADQPGAASGLASTLPAGLTVSNKRDAARMAFSSGMRAGAYLQIEGAGTPMGTRVVDLSIGGCSVEAPMSAGLLLKVDQPLPEVRLVFPNRDELTMAASVRHVGAAAYGSTARVGLAFSDMASEQQQKLWLWLRDIERDIATRAGSGSSLSEPCKLFISPLKTPSLPDPAARQLKLHDDATADALGVLREAARQLAACVIALRRGQRLPAAALYESAENLLELLSEDRACFLYALCCLDDQPALLRHAITVAGRLADLARAESALGPNIDDVVVAALLHELGKTLLAQSGADTLDTLIQEPPVPRMRDHPQRLLEQINAMNALRSQNASAIIGQINERLDGSGYPACAETDGLRLGTSWDFGGFGVNGIRGGVAV